MVQAGGASRRADRRAGPRRFVQVDGPQRRAGDAAPRLQVLRPVAAHRLLQGGPCAEPGARCALRREPRRAHPPASLLAALGAVPRPHPEPERSPGLDPGIEEPADRAGRRGCARAVPAGPRPARADLRVQAAHPRALRRGYRVRAHDHPARRRRDPLPALRQGLRRGRGQPARPEGPRLPHLVPVGGSPRARQPARPAGALRPPPDRRETRRQGAQGEGRDDDLPPLPPARSGAPARGCGAARGRRAQRAGRAFRGQRQEQHHRLARAPSGLAARCRERPRLRQRDRGHGSRRARQPAPGHHLPVRAQARGGAKDR